MSTKTEALIEALPPGLSKQRRPDPCSLVIFGASGDLTHRKLIPALYSLEFRGLLPERFAVVGVARTKNSTESWREKMREAVVEFGRDEMRDDVWRRLAAGMHYVSTDFASDGGENDVMELLDQLDEERGTAGNRVFYLAVPPEAIRTVVDKLEQRRKPGGWVRLIVEKPFGHDLASAKALNEDIVAHFDEREIFRIDHYLGKETVQNVLAFRFANGIFEPIWNRRYVDNIQITVAESLGIEGRAGFYDGAGAIRDVVQNHMLQLLAITAMEPPADFEADAVRNEKVKVVRALAPPDPGYVVRGQYGPGEIDGKEVLGYREEPGVASDSNTETYVALKVFVENWRWAGTPFYLRTGKCLTARETTIVALFRPAPHPPFLEIAGEGLRPNVLVIHVQPDEGISIRIGAKVPGQGMTIRPVHLSFKYDQDFHVQLPEAYEKLIVDAMLGDATLFTRIDEVEAQWTFVDSVVAKWAGSEPDFPNYAAGSRGPKSADALMARDSRIWCQ
ncbi:MAG: glucose-6-phosphate dehydrogenase [Gaiellaceae bacterium]|jgi:glucose-6-phosphate 1-dehydrogenase